MPNVEDMFAEPTMEQPTQEAAPQEPQESVPDIFGLVEEPQEQETANVEGEEQKTQEQIDWEKRYKDLQSYHDKKLNEYKTQSQQYEDAVVLQQFINQNPDIVQAIQAKLSGAPVQQTPQQTQPVEFEDLPRPNDFDPLDIYDQSTPSGKWFKQNEKAKEQFIRQQLVSELSPVLNELKQLPQLTMQQLEQRQQQEQLSRQRAENERMFRDKHKLDDVEYMQFQDFVTNGPEQPVTLDDLYVLYQHKRGAGTAPQAAPQQPVQNPLDSKLQQSRQSVPQVPQSITQVPGNAPKQINEADQFLVNMAKFNTSNVASKIFG